MAGPEARDRRPAGRPALRGSEGARGVSVTLYSTVTLFARFLG
jgi:hypothetical protein